MEEILEDFRKALSEAEKRGAVQYKAERNRTELDMAVLHYKQEKEKQEKEAEEAAEKESESAEGKESKSE